jgi:hypothetical protein
MKIKLFWDSSAAQLETRVNDWLAENWRKINIDTITHSSGGTQSNLTVTVMITYYPN